LVRKLAARVAPDVRQTESVRIRVGTNPPTERLDTVESSVVRGNAARVRAPIRQCHPRTTNARSTMTRAATAPTAMIVNSR